MERQPVKSCILRSVGYDDNLKNMEIEFHSGLIYQYSGVPSKVYADLMSSAAVGKFFSDKVRNRSGPSRWCAKAPEDSRFFYFLMAFPQKNTGGCFIKK